MSENELTEIEANREISDMLSVIERKKKWLVCRIKDKDALIPDTRDALGHDVFGVERFQCHPPSPDLIVSAWPLKFIWNVYAKGMFSKKMKYSEVDFNTMSLNPGVIEDNQVITTSERVMGK
jgi:hypothetical protein